MICKCVLCVRCTSDVCVYVVYVFMVCMCDVCVCVFVWRGVWLWRLWFSFERCAGGVCDVCVLFVWCMCVF